jgi:hypothetical protein
MFSFLNLIFSLSYLKFNLRQNQIEIFQIAIFWLKRQKKNFATLTWGGGVEKPKKILLS